MQGFHKVFFTLQLSACRTIYCVVHRVIRIQDIATKCKSCKLLKVFSVTGIYHESTLYNDSSFLFCLTTNAIMKGKRNE